MSSEKVANEADRIEEADALARRQTFMDGVKASKRIDAFEVEGEDAVRREYCSRVFFFGIHWCSPGHSSLTGFGGFGVVFDVKGRPRPDLRPET